MTARYLFQVIPAGQPPFTPASCAVATLSTVTDGVGFAAVHEPEDIALSLGPDGMVIGKLFSRVDNRPLVEIDDETREKVLRTEGRWLLENCWGAYVAILRRECGDDFVILRDPSGMLACYHTIDRQGRRFFTNEPELLREIGLRCDVDWTALANHLRSSDFRGARTCLAGLNELLAGCCLHTAAVDSIDTVWKPWDHVAPDWRFKREDPPDVLRRTVENCVGAWARSYDDIIMGISGGLDSSIVLAALKVAGAVPALYTLATRAADGDERDYARIVTEHLGFELEAKHYPMAVIDPLRSHVAHLARPVGNYFVQAVEHTAREQIRRLAGDRTYAIFSGGGGDNVFCFSASATPAADRLLHEGAGAGFWSTLYDIHSVTGASLPQILGKAVSQRFVRVVSRGVV